MKKLLLLFASCFLFIASRARDNRLSIGIRDSIYSNILKEPRELWIYTPDAYDSSKSYPVVYVLDGETFFQSFTGVLNHLENNGVVPEMILVGIVNTDRGRDLTPTHEAAVTNGITGGGETFTSFLEKEVIPHIEAGYHTVPYRILAGHSLGGLFSLNALYKHTSLFTSYIILDPSIEWDKRNLISQSPAILSRNKFKGKILFNGSSSLCIETGHEFDDTLKHHPDNGLGWISKYYPDEDHGTLPLRGFYDALHYIFSYYQRPSFVHLTDTSADIMCRHYKFLTEKMGYSILPPPDLIRGLAWRFRLDRKYDEGYRFLTTVNTYYPRYAIVYSELGLLFHEKGDEEKSIAYYNKAKTFNNKE